MDIGGVEKGGEEVGGRSGKGMRAGKGVSLVSTQIQHVAAYPFCIQPGTLPS